MVANTITKYLQSIVRNLRSIIESQPNIKRGQSSLTSKTNLCLSWPMLNI